MKKIFAFIKKEPVFFAAFLLALITAFLVPPSKEYIDYIDWRVLGILLSLMLVMKGFQKEGLFENVANGLLKRVGSFRALSAVLILLCFFTSMIITNDVALITFVPFTLQVLSKINRRDKMISVIVLQTIAANLGSMLTPIGNPQNLYIYGISNVSVGTIVLWMLPYSAVALVLILGFICFQSKERLDVRLITENQTEKNGEKSKENTQKNIQNNLVKIWIYFILFIICLMTVFRFAFMPWYVSLAIVVIVFFVVDKKVIPTADYMLLFTFIAFFVFIGNMGNIESIHKLLEGLIVDHELLLGVVSSQVVSNVPAALLLSGFTTNYHALLVGVNLGGLGTLIASMASLISYKLYAQCEDKGDGTQGKYFVYFTVANILFLLILGVMAVFVG